MTKLQVRAIYEGDGGVTLRIYRRKTENPEADGAPIPLTHGTLDIRLDDHEMAMLGNAISEALWEKVLKP